MRALWCVKFWIYFDYSKGVRSCDSTRILNLCSGKRFKDEWPVQVVRYGLQRFRPRLSISFIAMLWWVKFTFLESRPNNETSGASHSCWWAAHMQGKLDNSRTISPSRKSHTFRFTVHRGPPPMRTVRTRFLTRHVQKGWEELDHWQRVVLSPDNTWLRCVSCKQNFWTTRPKELKCGHFFWGKWFHPPKIFQPGEWLAHVVKCWLDNFVTCLNIYFPNTLWCVKYWTIFSSVHSAISASRPFVMFELRPPALPLKWLLLTFDLG